MQPLSGNQRPDLLMMNMSLVLCLPREMHLSRSSSNVPRLSSFLKLLQNLHVLLTFEQVHNPLRLSRKTTLTCGAFVHFDFDMCFTPQRRLQISTSKSAPRMCVLYILTSKCAWRHNGVHFFDIATSKSAPNVPCF